MYPLGTVSGEEELALFNVPSGKTYKLFTLAEDNVGQEQELETAEILEVYLPEKQGKLLSI